MSTIRLFCNARLFYSFDNSENRNENQNIYSLKLKKEVNSLSQLSFTILETHPMIGSIKQKRTTFLLASDDICLFIGKVSSINKSIFEGTVEIEVEDLLGSFRDEIVIDDSYVLVDDELTHIYTYRRLFEKLELFAQTYDFNSDWKKYAGNSIWLDYGIPKPNFYFNDSNISLAIFETKEDITGSDYLSLVFDRINSWCQGNISTEVTGSVKAISSAPGDIYYEIRRYSISYDNNLVSENTNRNLSNGYLIANIEEEPFYDSAFIYGENLLSIEKSPAQNDIFTCIFPYGNYTLIEGENESQRIVYSNPVLGNSELLRKYGRVYRSVNFGDIGSFSSESAAKQDLYNRAVEWAKDALCTFCDKIIVGGIDRYYLDSSDSERPIDIGDIVGVGAKQFGINSADFCLSLEIDYFSHENDRYVIGPFIPGNLLEYSVGEIYNTQVKASIPARSSAHFFSEFPY